MLQQIADEVRACTACRLHQSAMRAVPGEGPADAKVMFIGEAPGFHEDRQGRPFVGAAGQFLEELLGLAGLQRNEVFIANVIKHRPPDNRDPQPDEIAACSQFLDRQIAALNPLVIVTLGRFSMARWFPGEKNLPHPRSAALDRRAHDHSDDASCCGAPSTAVSGIDRS